jgi:hypothetical protein
VSSCIFQFRTCQQVSQQLGPLIQLKLGDAS